jgi:hypothetical protein
VKNKSDLIEKLVKFANNKLPASERREIKTLIESDADIAELLHVVKSLKKEGSAVNWNQIMKAATALSAKMFTDFKNSAKKKFAPLGITIYDSKVLPLPEGVRPAKVDTRRIKYKIEDIELDVSLYPISTNAYEIIGQLSGVEYDLPVKIYLRSGKTKLITKTDRFNLFRFAKVPIARYILKIHIDDKELGSVKIDL